MRNASRAFRAASVVIAVLRGQQRRRARSARPAGSSRRWPACGQTRPARPDPRSGGRCASHQRHSPAQMTRPRATSPSVRPGQRLVGSGRGGSSRAAQAAASGRPGRLAVARQLGDMRGVPAGAPLRPGPASRAAANARIVSSMQNRFCPRRGARAARTRPPGPDEVRAGPDQAPGDRRRVLDGERHRRTRSASAASCCSAGGAVGNWPGGPRRGRPRAGRGCRIQSSSLARCCRISWMDSVASSWRSARSRAAGRRAGGTARRWHAARRRPRRSQAAARWPGPEQPHRIRGGHVRPRRPPPTGSPAAARSSTPRRARRAPPGW